MTEENEPTELQKRYLEDDDGAGVDPRRDHLLRIVGYVGLLSLVPILGREVLTWDELGDWLLPAAVLTLLFVLVIVELVRTIVYVVREGELEDGVVTELTRRTTQYRREIIMVGWAVLFPILVWLIGFQLTIPLYIFTFIVYYERDVKLAAFVAVLFSVLLILLFTELLDVRLEEGLIGFRLWPILAHVG